MIHDIPTVFSSCQQRSRVAHLEKAAEVLLPSPYKTTDEIIQFPQNLFLNEQFWEKVLIYLRYFQQ